MNTMLKDAYQELTGLGWQGGANRLSEDYSLAQHRY
jgi:hypothetical protein